MKSKIPGRVSCIAAITLLAFFLLLGKVYWIQVWKHDQYAAMASRQHTQRIYVDYPRYEILDRNGRRLTGVDYERTLVVFPKLIEKPAPVAEAVSRILDIDEDELLKRITDTESPLVLASGFGAQIEKKLNSLGMAGLVVSRQQKRYRDDGFAVHVLGYINSKENKGLSGLEYMCDGDLRGRDGQSIGAFVDGKKRLIKGLGIRRQPGGQAAGPGGLLTTIDIDLQKIVEDVMDKQVKRGAAVVMDPSTGAVLAMASRPLFDPNHPEKDLNSLWSPFMNRALASYAPGSVFKIVIAAAALEEGKVSEDDAFYDPGYIDVRGRRFRCFVYDEGGHGHQLFSQAFAQSCNTVFINVGLMLGADTIIRYAEKFGMGSPTGIGLPEESMGNLPSPIGMSDGDIANTSIGQKDVRATPLQMASLMSVIANGGKSVKPHILLKAKAENYTPRQVIMPVTALRLREMLKACVKYGTGKNAQVEGYGAAGKTGSAQTGRVTQEGESISHAWFVGYSPVNEPELVISIFVEEGSSGGAVAAPVFKEIAEKSLELLHKK